MKRKLIILGVFLLMFSIMGLFKGKNMKSKEKIPQEVIEFAQLQEGGKLYYHGNWHEYKAYLLSYPELEKGDWGLPTYILFDGKKCKAVHGDEALDVMNEVNNP